MESKPLVIVNDLVALRQRSGVGFYVVELLGALSEINHPCQVVPLSTTWAGRPFCWASKLYETAQGKHSEIPGQTPAGWRRWVKRSLSQLKSAAPAVLERYLSTSAKTFGWRLIHEPDSCPTSTSTPTVTTVQDLSVVLHPEWHPSHRVVKFEKKFLYGLRQAQVLITSSESVKKELINHFGVDPTRVDVVPLAPRRHFRKLSPDVVSRARSRFSLSEEFLLFVGTIEPRKNLTTLLQAYAMLPAELQRKHPLVLIGGWGWNSEGIRDMLRRSPWSEHVRWLGYVGDDDLVALMNAAHLLVYPSLYEGFGLPPLEAMACGTAVLTTHAGGLQEAVGNAACIVDPMDESAMARKMEFILREPEHIEDLVEAGKEQVIQFDWHRTAHGTAEAYRKAA